MGGYIINWLAIPVFQLAIAELVYRGVRPDLLGYVVVGVAASTFIFNSQYYVGEILDGERIHGTLAGLFLAPCPRIAWLAGFAFGGLADTFLAAAAGIAFGMVVFGVRFHPAYPALILSFLLFFASLWGLGFIFSAIGLVLKRSNDLSNLLSPFIFLLGGIYYPISLLPLWLRIPAHALPFGYGMQAMADASLHHAGIGTLADQLLPLAGFAVSLPVLGVLAFGWVERKVRARGELELY
jgi:ABC-2 type transport system permease protein